VEVRNGGRYVPAEAIRLATSIAEVLARSDWTAILQHMGSQQEASFPARDLLSLAGASRDGQIIGAAQSYPMTLADPGSTAAAVSASDDTIEPYPHRRAEAVLLSWDPVVSQ
jgi:hypothetical protein